MPNDRERKEKVVFDATVVINFAQVDDFDILEKLYAGRGIVVAEVKEEILHEKSLRYLNNALSKGWLGEYALNSPEELYWFGRFTQRLSKGEAASLAAAKVKGWQLATDDLVARKLAKAVLGEHRILGSIGILISAVQKEVVPVNEAETLHKQMKDAGYYSPIASLKEFLEELG